MNSMQKETWKRLEHVQCMEFVSCATSALKPGKVVQDKIEMLHQNFIILDLLSVIGMWIGQQGS